MIFTPCVSLLWLITGAAHRWPPQQVQGVSQTVRGKSASYNCLTSRNVSHKRHGDLVPHDSAWPSVAASAAQVEAANAEVERGNQARQSDFSGAADRLRKLSTAEYEARVLLKGWG